MLVVGLLFGCGALWVMGAVLQALGLTSVDGRLVPLASTATHDPMIEEARRNSPGKTINPYKMFGMNT